MNDYYDQNNQGDIDEIIFRQITNHNIPTIVLDHEELKDLLKIFNYKLSSSKAFIRYEEDTSKTAKKQISKPMKN